MKRVSKYVVMACLAFQLGACETTGTTGPDMDGISGKTATHSPAEVSASLATLEKKYKAKPDDAATAVAYAKGLRRADFANQASIVLAPFAREKTAAPGVKAEMAAVQLALGNFDSAEEYGQQAVRQDPKDYLAYQNLGIALDAKGMHPEAERAFRKALENWQGDPTIVMNNLALNLASQNFIDEAIEVLEKAKAISPDRIELERNLRIVRTMKER